MRPNLRHSGWQEDESALWLGDARPAFEIDGTPGNDRLKGFPTADSFDVSQGGDDRVSAGAGDDTVYFGAAFTGADRVDGGKGVDTVTLDGDYSAGIDVQANSLTRIEQLALEGGSYVITGELNYKNVDGFAYVNGNELNETQSLNLDVATLNGLFALGGAGDDILHASANGHTSYLDGGQGNDTILGGTGPAQLTGNLGADRIVMANAADIAFYGLAVDSTAKSHDTIENFAASGGRIQLDFDSDTSTPGFEFDFHFGKTADRTGDILVTYDAGHDETIVKVFTDADHKADFVVHLTGDVPLAPADFIFG